jgi:hypothetical protein
MTEDCNGECHLCRVSHISPYAEFHFTGANVINFCYPFTTFYYPFQVLDSRVDYWPYLQTLDLAGKACQGQTL